MDIHKALQLWVEITGVNPNDSKISVRNMDIHNANEVIKRSLTFDESYVTTLLLLKPYLDDFTAGRSIFLKDIMDDFDTFTTWLAKINEFKSIVQSAEAEEIKSQFKESLKQAVSHYKVQGSVIESMIENESNLAELRYSAFHAIGKLEVNQFTHGRPSTNNPKIHDKVYLFRDINTLLQWMLRVDSGIVLALIQDPEQPASSFFVFAIRNGGTLSVITDREKTAHPLESLLSRSRAVGRTFHERIYANHFPYSLLSIQYGDNNRAYIKSNEKTMTIKEDGVALRDIRDLEPDEVVWLIMMFSLLSEKFFKQNFKTEKLSYTAKMMQESNLLLQQAEERGIVLHGYQPLIVPPLTKEDMNTEKVLDDFTYKPTGQHDWMIERYEVPEDAFDVLQNTDKLFLTNGAEADNLAVSIKKLPVSEFADAERLLKDRIYIARYNQAQVINRQVGEEYENRIEEVRKWYEQAVRKNLPNLLKAMAKGKFIISGDLEEAHIREGSWLQPQKDGNILRLSLLRDESFQGFIRVHIGGPSLSYRKLTCAVNDSKATLVGHFHPRTARMLADLCGCDVSELHELMRYWRIENLDKGNHILERIDPMDWAIINPWKRVNFDVRIYLSKTGYNELCKEHHTGNEKFWLLTETEK